jgi:type I restriction enzyme S subunit
MGVDFDELPLPDKLPVIPNGWRYEPLGDLVDERGVSYGIVQPGNETADGIPIVRVNNIRNGRIDTTDMLKVGADIEAKFQRSRLRGGEVLLTLVGTLGEVAIVPENLRGWNVARAVGVIPVRKDPGSLWVFICLRSAFIQHCIRIWATTTVQATFNLRDLAKLPIPTPPIETREAIAAVLGALDDKIELNRRMNATLEAMARALFQSWFVDFDPVRAKLDGRQPLGLDPTTAALFPASFQSSQSGSIPAGWGHTTLAEFCSKITDGAHQSPKSVDAGFPMASVKDMTDWEINIPSCRHISEVDYKSLVANGCQPELGDILLAKDGATCLDTACEYQQTDKIVLLSSVAILRPKHVCDSAFLHTWFGLSSAKTYLKENFVSGSAIPRVVLRDMKRATFISPPRNILNAFSHAAAPLREQIRHNHEQSRTLATLRDTLLPKLLSGKISTLSKTL